MQHLVSTLKQFGAGVRLQSRELGRVLFFLYLPIALLFLVVGVLSRVSDNVTLSLLMRDIVTMGKLPFYTGFVPQVEALLWSASLTVCLFTRFVLQRQAGQYADARRFLLHVSILTGMLMIDDIFLFHGEVAPKYLHIASEAVVAGYLVIAVFVVASNWTEILSSEYLILLLALVMFGSSIFFDVLSKLIIGLSQVLRQFSVFFEDGIKFAGTATWLTYFVRYTVQKIDSFLMKKATMSGGE